MVKKAPLVTKESKNAAEWPSGEIVIKSMTQSEMQKHYDVEAEWPSGEFEMKDVYCLCPQGAYFRADFQLQRYQVSYR